MKLEVGDENREGAWEQGELRRAQEPETPSRKWGPGAGRGDGEGDKVMLETGLLLKVRRGN